VTVGSGIAPDLLDPHPPRRLRRSRARPSGRSWMALPPVGTFTPPWERVRTGP